MRPLLAALLLSLPAAAAPLAPGVPALSLALESGVIQTDSDHTPGINTSLWVGWRFSDQLSITGMGSIAASRAGPFSTLGFGLQGLLDATPVAPFFDLQAVLLGPLETVGYSLAMRLGLGADWKISQAFSLGLAVRTLTPLDSNASTRALGTEIALRLVMTPATFR